MVAEKEITTPPTNSSPDAVEQYAREVTEGREVAGPLVRHAAERHLRDLRDGPKRGLRWDRPWAERTYRFFENVLRLAGGEDEGKPFVLQPPQKFIIGSLFGWKIGSEYRFNTAYIEMGKGGGKALSLDTPIATSFGWSTMADIRPGDFVFDENGAPCMVTGATETMRGHECYEVVFDDGSKITADADHLWLTEQRCSGDKSDRGRTRRGVRKKDWGKWQIALRSTKEIAKTIRYDNGKYKSANHSVTLTGPLQCHEADLPIDPYVLGAWLGDGNSADARFTVAYADWQIVDEMVLAGVSASERPSKSTTTARVTLGKCESRNVDKESSLQFKLRKEGVLNNKHIPDRYLRASVSQRIDLLQGLMDTDGTIGESGKCEFTSTSKRLADGALEVMLSLGIKANMATGRATLYGKDVGPKYRIHFCAPTALPIFRLQRKLDRQVVRHSRRKLSGERRIVSCSQVDSVPVKCISVDSPSRMYLAGRTLIPTHNSPMAGGIGVLKMCADNQPRAQVFTAATDKEQARIPFLSAVAMVDQSPALSQHIVKSPRDNPDPNKVWNLAHIKSGSSMRPIASESLGRGKSGFRPYCVILDEIHEHPTDAMVEFMRKNLKGRPNSLVLMITNSGVYNIASVCWRYHDYSDQLMNQKLEDDRFFSYVCGLDAGDSFTDPAVWKKSNPLLGVTIPYSYLEQEVREARGMPSKQSLTRRLNFCEWVESADPWIDADIWRANGGEADVESLKGRRCWGGLDLSRRNDLTALVFVFEPDSNGKKAVLCFFWKAADTLREHADRDIAPYVDWKEQGLLLTTPGKAINYEFIATELDKLAARYQIEAIAFDPAKIDEMTPYLNKIGADIVFKKHNQGFTEMDAAITAAETDLLEGNILHGNHPVLTWCVNNAKTTQNSETKRMFDKRKATGRIDGAVAFAMADELAQADAGESIYATQDPILA